MTSTELRTYSHEMLKERTQEIFTKLKNGDTETSYQIGGASYTDSEWNKIIKKFDENIDEVKKQQEEHKVKQEEKENIREIYERERRYVKEL